MESCYKLTRREKVFARKQKNKNLESKVHAFINICKLVSIFFKSHLDITCNERKLCNKTTIKNN